MGRYLAKRILLGCLSLWVLVSICFFLLRFLPGSPFSEDEAFHPRIRAEFEKNFGLHDSLPTQYFRYLKNLSQGDLGPSLSNPETEVSRLLGERLETSFVLGSLALVVVLLGASIYALTLSNHPSRLRLGGVISLLAFAVPSLILAPFLVDLFALRLGWLPVARLESLWGYVLPVTAISFRPICRLGQIFALEIHRLRATDSARTFRSLGFGERRIVLHWILPEALVAVLAQMGSLIATLLTGSFFVEIVFAIPGLGSLFSEALSARDYPVVLGITLWIGSLVFIAQLVIDVLLALIDPRIRPDEVSSV